MKSQTHLHNEPLQTNAVLLECCKQRDAENYSRTCKKQRTCLKTHCGERRCPSCSPNCKRTVTTPTGISHPFLSYPLLPPSTPSCVQVVLMMSERYLLKLQLSTSWSPLASLLLRRCSSSTANSCTTAATVSGAPEAPNTPAEVLIASPTTRRPRRVRKQPPRRPPSSAFITIALVVIAANTPRGGETFEEHEVARHSRDAHGAGTYFLRPHLRGCEGTSD